MSFWNNVDMELRYLGMTHAALADKIGCTASNISRGLRTGSSTSAETAVRIARLLGVTVEYLVTGVSPSVPEDGDGGDRLLLRKYSALLSDLDVLPEHEREAVALLVSELRRRGGR